MTTLLLTGAGGFLGSHILQAVLTRTDWNVVAVDSFRHNGGTDRIQAAIGDDLRHGGDYSDIRVKVITHDITAPFSNNQRAEMGLVDYVVHAAANCSVDHSIRWPYEHVMNNVQSTLTMLQHADSLKNLKRYLHVSTDEVFGPFLGGHTTTTAHNPSSPYAASKAACEDLTVAWARTYGVPASIVNSANLFGERQSQLAFIPKVIRLVSTGEPVPIHLWADLPAWRWYTYAPNMADWVIQHLTAANWKARTQLTGQLGTDVKALAGRIAAIMGLPIEYDEIRGQDVRPGIDAGYGKLDQDPTWKPDVDADDGLVATVRWFMENPSWLIDG